MALNLNDRKVLMEDVVMQRRIASACANYAKYLLDGSPDTAQAGWARGCLDNPNAKAVQVAQYIVNAPEFVGSGGAAITGDTWVGGSSLSDATLKGIVEAAINAFLIGA